ncbi:MAG: hypothetical protein OEW45_06205 [Deltaproteobacteria bacterium]|nr:hypothetical protein [Deltaproteobacteria bacterium]
MKIRPKILFVGASLLLFGMMATPSSAKPAAYCLECHSQDYSQKYSQPFSPSRIAGSKSVYHAKLDPCPGVRLLSEEIFFTANRILKLDQIINTLDRERNILKKKVVEIADSFSELQNREQVSVAQFAQETSSQRAALQKVYERTLQIRDESARRWLIGLGSLIFLGLFALGALAYHRLNRWGKMLLLFMLIGASFSAGACSYGAKEPAKKNPNQERLEQSLAVASQSSRRMEETFSQAIVLADLAREWSKIEAGPSEKAFQLSWQMALNAREKANQVAMLEAVVSEWPDRETARKQGVDFNTVLDLRDELRSAKGRSWGLRAVAEEWARAIPHQGRSALESASQETLKIKDRTIRDQELKPLAEAWVGINADRAVELSRLINDPFLRALSLTHVVLATRIQQQNGKLLEEAWKAAESISPSYPRIKAFVRIAAAGGQKNPHEKNTWAEKALEKFQRLTPQLHAFALQEMIFHWAPQDWEQAERWAAEISPDYPATRAYSFTRVAEITAVPGAKACELLKRAWVETSKISDSGEALKIKSLIAKKMFEVCPEEAQKIIQQAEDPFYRSEILELLVQRFAQQNKREAMEFAARIPWEAFRQKALVKITTSWMSRDVQKVISLYRETLQVTRSISDPYIRALTLVELGKKWAQIEREKGQAALQLAEKAADEIFSLPVKAEVLESVAASWKGSDPQRAQAILEKVDSSVLQIRQSLEEIRLWAKVDPVRAKNWAEALPSAFPLERAMAFQEAAGTMKKSHPDQAFYLLQKAMDQVLALPEGAKTSKLLSQLVMEAASMNKIKTLRKLQEIPSRETRDLLLKEAGKIWVKKDPPPGMAEAIQAAYGISESSLRLDLCRKIADQLAKKFIPSEPDQPDLPELKAIYQWGLGREMIKNDESRATPFFIRALQESEKIKEPKERSYFLCGLAVDWAPLNEEKALEVAGKISADFPEPYSYALLQVGTRLQKWNRKKAEDVLHKTLGAAEKIKDPALRAQRVLQLARQWHILDKEKGKEVLKKAEGEARDIIPSTGKENKIHAEILRQQSFWEPEQALAVAAKASSPFLRAKILLESAEVFSKMGIAENIKILEKAFSYAQQEKNSRLMGEIAVAWFAYEPNKGLDVLAQVEPKEIRFHSLLQMARMSTAASQDESKRLLKQAAQEVEKIDGIGDRIRNLKEIAGIWVKIDKEMAQKTYRQAMQIAEKTVPSSPNF